MKLPLPNKIFNFSQISSKKNNNNNNRYSTIIYKLFKQHYIATKSTRSSNLDCFHIPTTKRKQEWEKKKKKKKLGFFKNTTGSIGRQLLYSGLLERACPQYLRGDQFWFFLQKFLCNHWSLHEDPDWEVVGKALFQDSWGSYTGKQRILQK